MFSPIYFNDNIAIDFFVYNYKLKDCFPIKYEIGDEENTKDNKRINSASFVK